MFSSPTITTINGQASGGILEILICRSEATVKPERIDKKV
jgi:hypothetical protein